MNESARRFAARRKERGCLATEDRPTAPCVTRRVWDGRGRRRADLAQKRATNRRARLAPSIRRVARSRHARRRGLRRREIGRPCATGAFPSEGEGVCDAQYERRGGDAVELEGVERGPAGGALHGGHVVCGGGGR